ncbi:complement C5-like [Rhopilema esculentum]|uniref:complement C5-like n=1 Tax=Rhopilema esculentum TaxID=499914 RepID=UPI0031D1A69E
MQAGINQINYLFLSRGKIVKTGVIQKQIGTETTLNVDITADMAPKCRILAFFVRNGEMASDSVLMDVENGYKNEVLLNTDPAPDQTFRPGQDLAVKMKTSTKSVVGLLAVDQSIYYLRNESRVTNEKVFSDIGSFDLGCGLGSGRNNKDVFDVSCITDSTFNLHFHSRCQLAIIIKDTKILKNNVETVKCNKHFDKRHRASQTQRN